MIVSAPPSVQFFAAITAFILGLRLLYREFGSKAQIGLGRDRQRLEIQKAFRLLQEVEELLGAGMIPSAQHWTEMQTLAAPWGALTYESLKELREAGGAVLPTLRRLKELASGQLRALAEGKARTAQAFVQGLVCLLMVPVFSASLYYLLPGVSESPALWICLTVVSLLMGMVGVLWLLSMSQAARWAGLPPEARSWILASQCAGERFLALVRAGNPADLAWSRAMELLSREASALALIWGHSIWKSSSGSEFTKYAANGSCRLFFETGDALRKAVQVSLMEGRPCSDRIESAMTSLSHEIRARVEAELTLLPTRALKPLFLCVAPGVFLLLGAGFFLCFSASGAGAV